MTNTVKIGDAVVFEAIHASELQTLLRSVGKSIGGGHLAHCIVTTPSELEPWVVAVEGALQIGGQPHFWSVPCDLRSVKNADDIVEMCGQLEASFDKAASTLGRP